MQFHRSKPTWLASPGPMPTHCPKRLLHIDVIGHSLIRLMSLADCQTLVGSVGASGLK
jgi:hypothetical protein